ncbi:MAG: TlpA family protein disulfide reductase, partial [Streptosporangiaceae bacterium]
MFKTKRRLVVLGAAMLAAAALVIVLVAGWAGSGQRDVTDVDGNASAVLYTAGHQPLAPDFTATTLTGAKLNFASYRGKVVVLNFWGSWCGPCRKEAPTLAVAAEQYKSAGVDFLGVDVRDTTASAEAFTRNFGITYPSVSDAGSVITLDFTA